MVTVSILAVLAVVASPALAQTFRRTGTCPTLGCVFPPDQTSFIAGQVFDMRIELQAPVNGSEAYNGGKVTPEFTFKIGGVGAKLEDVTEFFKISAPASSNYSFNYYEDLFLQDAKNATTVNVVARSYRNLQLFTPGNYVAELTYNGGAVTRAYYEVLPLAEARKAKNVILFIGDGMSTAMITAARLIGHKSINGKYQSKMTLDSAPAYGAQMTHSIDSFITDSANSATALYSGMKSTVNALNAYTDSSGKPTGNPKFETVFEMFRRIYGGVVGIVSTAYLADATPAAVCTHTSQRSAYDLVIQQFLTGVNDTAWYPWKGVDILFGAGAEYFLPRSGNGNVSQFDKWAKAGYTFASNKTSLASLSNSSRALGLFSRSNLPVWLDRNVFTKNLNSTLGYDGKPVTDLPGLKEMTIKAIDIASTRAKARGTGWMIMSEAASIDKQMHTADYDRALGELLELDDTVRATIQHLKDIGEYESTLVIVTADHAHGFDVFGSADTSYLTAQKGDRAKRNAVGTYQNSGLSQYQTAKTQRPDNHTVVYGQQGPNFPVQWDPRYTYAAGFGANPDHREDYIVHQAPREMAAPLINGSSSNNYVNPSDSVNGFVVNGTIPVSNDQGVHSLQDVPVYAWGPGSEAFRGIQSSIEIAHKIALALDLGRTSNVTAVYTV